MRTINHRNWFWVLGAMVLLVAGCDRPPDDVISPTQANMKPGIEPPMRVVSLAPAITQIMVDMQLEKLLVGVAENDLAAPKGLPVVGNFQDINSEAMLKARPTHVLMMTGKSGPPPRLSELSASQKFELVTYPSPESVSEVGNVIFNEEERMDHPAHPPLPSLGTVLEDALAAQRVKYKMLIQLGQIAAATATLPKPRVLMVIGTGPFMACGPKTVHDELLRMIGADNAAKDAKVGAPTFDKEKLLQTAPEVIVLVLGGAPPLEPIDQDPRLAELRGLDIPAVRNNRIHLINDPAAMLPSSTLARVAALLAKAVHPEAAAQIDQAMIVTPTTAPAPELNASTQPTADVHAAP